MYSIGQIIVFAIVLGALWAIFNTVVELPPKAKTIVNIILAAILAILAIKLLLSFV
jgi:arginine exporter protein ArgO